MILTNQLGLADNNAMMDVLEKMIAAKRSVSVVMLDIDSFKKINDQYGHEGGDAVIKNLAELLLQTAKEHNGFAFRTYGDEFGMVILDLTLEEVFLKAEDFRRSFTEQPGGAIWATVSVGVANFPRDAKETDSLIRAASAALYTAKENGRNRVSLSPNEEMVMKTCYYTAASVSRLKQLAGQVGKKESELLREALENLLRQYDDLQ